MLNKERMPALTGLKGIFIFFIVFFHTLPHTPFIEKIPLTSFIGTYGGTLGNYMFFMLSGFLISCGYHQRICEHTISFRDYLVRRLQKQYPLYILSNLVMLILTVWEFGWSGINLKLISFTALLQAGGGLVNTPPYNGPTWFLSALFACYVTYYAIAYYARRPTQYYCAIAAGIVWGYTLYLKQWEIPFCYVQNGNAFMNFFIGCGLAVIYPRMDEKVHRWLPSVALVVLVGSAYLLMRYGVEIIAGDSRTAFGFLICPLILYCSLESKMVSAVLRSKPIVWLGKISASVYFWHFVVYVGFRFLYGQIFPGKAILEPQYLCYFVLMLLVSALSWKLSERSASALQASAQNVHS